MGPGIRIRILKSSLICQTQESLTMGHQIEAYLLTCSEAAAKAKRSPSTAVNAEQLGLRRMCAGYESWVAHDSPHRQMMDEKSAVASQQPKPVRVCCSTKPSKSPICIISWWPCGPWVDIPESNAPKSAGAWCR